MAINQLFCPCLCALAITVLVTILLYVVWALPGIAAKSDKAMEEQEDTVQVVITMEEQTDD